MEIVEQSKNTIDTVAVDNVKVIVKEKELKENIENQNFDKHDFVRFSAVDKIFKKCSFKYSIFNECYLRKCSFVECDFTGCVFKSSVLRGSQFNNCRFGYTSWEKTIIDDDFINEILPSEENIARDLVRSLRVNYAQIGNYDGVNKASAKENRLTGTHYYKAAFSDEGYYRSKYKGFERFKMVYRFLSWKFLDLVWGNGESIIKIVASIAFIIFLGSVFDYTSNKSNPDFWGSVSHVASVYIGTPGVTPLNAMLTGIIVVSRLLLFGMFMSVLVKRLSRR